MVALSVYNPFNVENIRNTRVTDVIFALTLANKMSHSRIKLRINGLVFI